MADPAAAVRGLIEDIERVAAAADGAARSLRAAEREASDRAAASARSLEEAGREAADRAVASARSLEEAGREARENRGRAERAERALAILQEERKLIRGTLRRVTGNGGASPNAEPGAAGAGRADP